MIPKQLWLTRGFGFHKDRLNSFEMSLRDAKISNYNLVQVSSIFPPKCKIISSKKGTSLLRPGQIVYTVLSRNQSNERGRLISASIGLALPEDRSVHGYLTELHTEGMNELETRDWSEDQAAEMLASTLGIQFDGDKAWDKEKDIYRLGNRVVKTRSICSAAECLKGGWTTVVAACIFITE